MSQPEMRSDRLRAELAEVKRQRDELRKALDHCSINLALCLPLVGDREACDLGIEQCKGYRALIKRTEAP
jgi:hypothetical protein